MDSFFKFIGVGFVVILTIVIIALLLAFPAMWAWNYVMPYLFGLKTIGPLQAFCLMFLSGLFFKSSFTCKEK